MIMTNSELLDRYEAMRRISQHMLEAAQKSNWDQLVKLEQSRAGFEKDLRREDRSEWRGKDAAKKAEVIRAILDTDAQTSQLVQQQMNEMQKSLTTIGTGRKMKQAYERA